MDSEEYDAYTTSMEDLGSLQAELSHLAPWTCNNRVRQLINKTAIKVHKEPNQDLRRILLTEIASTRPILKGLLTLCEESSEPQLLSNIIVILRECVTARAPWRPQVLAYLLQNNGTEIMTQLLTKIFNPKEKGKPKQMVSNHTIICIFWILSALATKDVNFSVKVRSCGCIKLLVSILKHLSGQQNQLYAVLQCMKALSRNNVTATILGREGIIQVMIGIITKLATTSFGPKLKVATEVLASLTKPKQNQIILVKQKFSGELLDILCRQQSDSETGKIASRIAGAILTTFYHLVPSKSGLQQFVENGGIGVLRHFCLSLDSTDQRWDRLLCRACTVLSQCCPRKSLPVEQETGPLTFILPKDCQDIVIDESPSDSTSRETTPESDDDDDDEDDNDNDEENFAQIDGSQITEENLGDSDLQPIQQRSKQDIETSYNKFFREFHESKVHGSEDFDSCNNNCLENSSYLDYARHVRGLCRFVKVAYPDMIGAKSPSEETPEVLLEKNRRSYRSKLIQNMKTLLNETSEEEWTIAYDLDQLLMENKLLENSNSAFENLGNDDELQIKLSSQALNTLDSVSVGAKSRKQLKFESRFESGNLRRAIRIRDREYNLILSPDVNSRQQLQWFYFQVSNMASGLHSPYVFNIINYEKANSQFNFGMQPVMFSVREALLGRPHWRRVGEDVCYYRNHFSNASHVEGQNYMTVTFSVTFPHDADICYLAYHYPYTYTRLLRHLDVLKTTGDDNSEKPFYFRVDHLTDSLNGHQLPLVTITAPIKTANGINNQNVLSINDRRVVFLTARVHPGETNSSWIMEGVLDYLTSQSCEAKELRANYLFKIVPMLNVEGCINGSHRCGLTGEDLNRRWRDPRKQIHPEIFHTKGLLSYFKNVLEKEVFLFCDFHGHSRKKNVFLYGCSSDQSWWSKDREFEDDPSTYMELADVFSSLDQCLDKKSCRYLIERSRESTARVVVWREFDVQRSYTLEASFCGCNKGILNGQQMSTKLLLDVGRNFARSLLYLDPNCSDSNDGDFQSAPEECRASVEKDAEMKITRLVISMPHS